MRDIGNLFAGTDLRTIQSLLGFPSDNRSPSGCAVIPETLRNRLGHLALGAARGDQIFPSSTLRVDASAFNLAIHPSADQRNDAGLVPDLRRSQETTGL